MLLLKNVIRNENPCVKIENEYQITSMFTRAAGVLIFSMVLWEDLCLPAHQPQRHLEQKPVCSKHSHAVRPAAAVYTHQLWLHVFVCDDELGVHQIPHL